MGEWLLDNGWVAALIWAPIYVSDYYLTIWAAKVYDRAPHKYFEFSGSYELNPIFHDDVDNRRMFSRRFLTLLAVYMASIAAIWFGAVVVLGIPAVFEVYVGALIFLEVPVHMRHVRNLATFHAWQEPGIIAGHITYSRRLAFKLSAVEALSFAVFFALLAALFQSWLLAGGALACAAIGRQHWQWMRQLPAQVEPQEACA